MVDPSWNSRMSLSGLLRPNPWSLGAALIAGVVLMPILAVIWLALTPTENIWGHLVSTTLPRYLRNSLVLMSGTGLLSALFGTAAAWCIVRYRFPGARAFEWLLLLPLGIPAYVGAYALVDFLEYAGPVQTRLRLLFGWSSARDYWFPEIRSMGGAIIVLASALFPYVYLLARAAFRDQSAQADEVARSLGARSWRRFLSVGLPLARPAVVAGTAIVMMETINDFGTVDYFAVQTLTTGIFTTWLEANNAAGAAQIASVILGLVVFLILAEKASRRRIRTYAVTGKLSPIAPVRLRGARAGAATLLCALPFTTGFVLPFGVVASHAASNMDYWRDASLLRATMNTLFVAGTAACLTVAAALFMVYGVRLSGRRLPQALLPITTIGYAAPGAVLAVGILLPLAALDQRVADGILALTGWDPGLILTGTSAALILAYSLRFFAIAQGAADAAMSQIPKSLPLAARSLGRTRGRTLVEIYLPLIRGSTLSALLLVFVDCVKELPATLLLRPFNFSTLSTRVYEQASLENLGDASPAAILVVLVGLAAVLLLARSSR
ncbi:ABC transporter permease [Poseidonocella sedimentorum]